MTETPTQPQALKPCPFCGVILEDIGEFFARHAFVKEGCPLSQSDVYIEKWNRRVPVLSAEDREALKFCAGQTERNGRRGGQPRLMKMAARIRALLSKSLNTKDKGFMEGPGNG